MDRPVKDLKAFEKVSIAAGETKTITLCVNAPDLAFYNEKKSAWETESIEYIVYAGPSSKQEGLLKDTFKITV